MQIITVYRYIRNDGGTTVSTVKPEVECEELYRVVADEGFVLTDGVKYTYCIDTAELFMWNEVADVDDNNSEVSAEVITKAHAYDIITGAVE